MNSKMTVCTWKQGVGVKTGYGRENQYMYVKMCANGREKTMNVRVKKRENRENGVYGRPSRFSGTFWSDAHAHLEKSFFNNQPLKTVYLCNISPWWMSSPVRLIRDNTPKVIASQMKHTWINQICVFCFEVDITKHDGFHLIFAGWAESSFKLTWRRLGLHRRTSNDPSVQSPKMERHQFGWVQVSNPVLCAGVDMCKVCTEAVHSVEHGQKHVVCTDESNLCAQMRLMTCVCRWV